MEQILTRTRCCTNHGAAGDRLGTGAVPMAPVAHAWAHVGLRSVLVELGEASSSAFDGQKVRPLLW